MSQTDATHADHSCCQSFNGGTVWICGRDDETSEWRRTTHLQPRGWNGRVFVPCCNRLELPKNTEAQWYSAYGGYVSGWRFRCAPNAGCNVRSGYRRTAHLREGWYAY